MDYSSHCILQLLAFVGQGASAAAGEAINLPSNFFEQLVTWALLVLGWKLDRELREEFGPPSQGGAKQPRAAEVSESMTASLMA